jgi:MFS family permease
MYLFYLLVDFILGIFFTCWIANLLSHGLSLQQACLAAAAWFGSIAIFEVPTGYISDRYGRKFSVICGLIGLSIGLGCLGLTNDTLLTSWALIIAGISATLISGARDAWFYNFANDTHQNFDSESFWLKTQLVGRIGMISGSFVGAYLTSIKPASVWWLVVVVGTLASIVALKTPQGSTDKHEDNEPIKLKSIVKSIKSPILIMIFVATIFFGFEAGVRNMIYQPFILELNDGKYMYLAYFQATLALARILGILTYRYWLKRFNMGGTFVIAALVIFAIAEWIASTATNYWTFIPFYCFAIFSLGWYFPVRMSILNHLVQEKFRATILSVDSMLDTGMSALACLMLYFFIAEGDIAYFWRWGSVGLMLSAISFGIAMRLQRKMVKG